MSLYQDLGKGKEAEWRPYSPISMQQVSRHFILQSPV